MADMNAQPETLLAFGGPNWGAIWAGVFTFIAIWAVFGALGFSIFGVPSAAAGLNVGIAVWGIILTIIAMFVAGRITGGVAGINNSRQGVSLGMIMFGLTITAVAILVAIGGGVLGIAAGGVHGAYAIGVLLYGWPTFVALFLGWLAALGGASTAHKPLPVAATSTTTVQHQVRHA